MPIICHNSYLDDFATTFIWKFPNPRKGSFLFFFFSKKCLNFIGNSLTVDARNLQAHLYFSKVLTRCLILLDIPQVHENNVFFPNFSFFPFWSDNFSSRTAILMVGFHPSTHTSQRPSDHKHLPGCFPKFP